MGGVDCITILNLKEVRVHYYLSGLGWSGGVGRTFNMNCLPSRLSLLSLFALRIVPGYSRKGGEGEGSKPDGGLLSKYVK